MKFLHLCNNTLAQALGQDGLALSEFQAERKEISLSNELNPKGVALNCAIGTKSKFGNSFGGANIWEIYTSPHFPHAQREVLTEGEAIHFVAQR